MSCDFYLKIDYRERDLYLLLTKLIESKYSNLNIELSKTNLEIGDVVVLNDKEETPSTSRLSFLKGVISAQ